MYLLFDLLLDLLIGWMDLDWIGLGTQSNCVIFPDPQFAPRRIVGRVELSILQLAVWSEPAGLVVQQRFPTKPRFFCKTRFKTQTNPPTEGKLKQTPRSKTKPLAFHLLKPPRCVFI